MHLSNIEKEQMEVADTVSEYIRVLRDIIDRGGPDVSEYEYLKHIPKGINDLKLSEQLEIFEMRKVLFVDDSMIGFTFNKPHGYAGDFELIDRIYSKRKSKNINLYKWDKFYHDMEGARAVRNRKDYFKHLAIHTENKNKEARVLNLGSGPCVDLLEFLRTKRNHTLKIECLDMDQNAIDFGSTVCDNYTNNIKFIKENALKFYPDYQYDLIWSAGLFDYFNDKIFIRVVRKIYELVISGGELVIGNFSTYNPSRAVMEHYCQWYLYHRSEDTLIDLAIKAGVPKEQITVSQEGIGVNLFLHLRKQ